MPNIVIHEQVGYLLSKKININSYDYYLGLLAPDSPNINGLAPKNERWQAHVRKKDLQDWKKSLHKFYKKEKNNYNKDFIIGYVIHILTDIVYDESYYLKVKDKIQKDYINEDSHIIMRNDMDNYSFRELKYIYEILREKDITYSINNISTELMKKWKSIQIEKNIGENTSKYIDEKLVKQLTKKVEKELYLIID